MSARSLLMPDGSLLRREDGLPLIMGILNLTPDSFSDGGQFDGPKAAIDHALKMAEEGADIIDIGAESTRPGAKAIIPTEEWRRLEPVVGEVATRLSIPVSIDTYRTETALRALDAGAAIINDVSAGRMGEGMYSLAAARSAPMCLMHMQGEPRTMQNDPEYRDVVVDVYEFLERHVHAAKIQGIAPERIIVDPGFGFGKTPAHNIELIKHLSRFRELGLVLMGLSRKSTLAALSGTQDECRLPESIAGAIISMQAGGDILRVHEVEPTIRALAVASQMPIDGRND